MVDPNILIIKLRTGRLSRDTQTFGKMDPYCIIKSQNQTKRSSTHKNGGKFPKWTDQIQINIGFDQKIELQCWDQDAISNDDLIGKTEIDLSTVRQRGKVAQWFTLYYKGKVSGQLNIELEIKSHTQQSNIQHPIQVPTQALQVGTYLNYLNMPHQVGRSMTFQSTFNQSTFSFQQPPAQYSHMNQHNIPPPPRASLPGNFTPNQQNHWGSPTLQPQMPGFSNSSGYSPFVQQNTYYPPYMQQSTQQYAPQAPFEDTRASAPPEFYYQQNYGTQPRYPPKYQ